MSLNVTAKVSSNSSLTEVITIGAASANVPTGISYVVSFGNGSGANNINEYWTDTSTPAASTPDAWTLSALSEAISGGATRTVALTKVRHLKIVNNDTTDGHTLTVTGGATAPVAWLPPSTAQGIVIPAGGCLELNAPLATALAVASGTADKIKIDPGANAGNYTIEIWGE